MGNEKVLALVSCQPDHHRRILRDLEEEVAEVAERVLPEQLDLPLRPPEHARLVREQLRALQHARFVSQLAEAGGEVVVPEQRHLLLQRTTRVDHPEHPPLTGIVNVDVRREEAAALVVRRIDLRVILAADACVHIVGTTFVVHEMRNGLRKRHVLICVHFGRADAEPSASQQMIDLGI
jgi:hypothetical protein